MICSFVPTRFLLNDTLRLLSLKKFTNCILSSCVVVIFNFAELDAGVSFTMIYIFL